LDARTIFLTCKQELCQTPEAYLSTLWGWEEAIESYGGSIAESFELINNHDDEGNPWDIAMQTAMACDRTLTMALIRGADPSQYGTLIIDLSNQHAMGIDNYPSDLTSAYALLENYKTPTNSQEGHSCRPAVPAEPTIWEEGIMFVQSASVTSTNRITHNSVECYHCHWDGHYAMDCPDAPNITLLQHGFTLMQSN
jgi:hypothetical protein